MLSLEQQINRIENFVSPARLAATLTECSPDALTLAFGLLGRGLSAAEVCRAAGIKRRHVVVLRQGIERAEWEESRFSRLMDDCVSMAYSRAVPDEGFRPKWSEHTMATQRGPHNRSLRHFCAALDGDLEPVGA